MLILEHIHLLIEYQLNCIVDIHYMLGKNNCVMTQRESGYNMPPKGGWIICTLLAQMQLMRYTMPHGIILMLLLQ